MAIRQNEFARRRARLMERMEPDSIAILQTGTLQTRNRDVEYPFRPESDFYYLTGFPEPNAVLVLIPGRAHGEYVLFCDDRDPEREIWNGYRAGPDGARATYQADDAFPVGDMDDILPGLIEGRTRVYYSLGKDPVFDRRVMDWVNVIRGKVRNGAHPPGEFVSLDHLLHEQRLYKSAAEQRIMRNAATVSAAAHRRAMQACRPGLYEYHLEAEIQYEFMRAGARSPAYPSIVGSGENACILHYTTNDARMRGGDLVLIDAGCELDCYASDITRTFPVSGRFSRAQRAIYEIVHEAQLAAIEQVKPGNHWNQPHEAAVEVITAGLIRLGLLKGNLRRAISSQAYRRFYMHRTGHWLGMDVHDVGDYRVGEEWRVFEPGMTLTVEPGIYVGPSQRGVATKWRGIGVRIEDDVLVTRSGNEVLSAGVPKAPSEVEHLVRG